MAVSEDKSLAVVGWYRVLNGANMPLERLRLKGLDENRSYWVMEDGQEKKGLYYGDELMYAGLQVMPQLRTGIQRKPAAEILTPEFLY